jgi:hypothetical protein
MAAAQGGGVAGALVVPHSGPPSAGCSLLDLPDELIVQIVAALSPSAGSLSDSQRCLPLRSRIRLAGTCRALRRLVLATAQLWHGIALGPPGPPREKDPVKRRAARLCHLDLDSLQPSDEALSAFLVACNAGPHTRVLSLSGWVAGSGAGLVGLLGKVLAVPIMPSGLSSRKEKQWHGGGGGAERLRRQQQRRQVGGACRGGGGSLAVVPALTSIDLRSASEVNPAIVVKLLMRCVHLVEVRLDHASWIEGYLERFDPEWRELQVQVHRNLVREHDPACGRCHRGSIFSLETVDHAVHCRECGMYSCGHLGLELGGKLGGCPTVHRCWRCDEGLCTACAVLPPPCLYCGKVLCANCADQKTCGNCDQNYCGTCNNGSSCVKCNYSLCEHCLATEDIQQCGSCSQSFCTRCSRVEECCSRCNVYSCTDCETRRVCEACGGFFCTRCNPVLECGRCLNVRCAECEPPDPDQRCDHCSTGFCKYCSDVDFCALCHTGYVTLSVAPVPAARAAN